MNENLYSKALKNISIVCDEYLKSNDSSIDKNLIKKDLVLIDVLVDKTIPVDVIKYNDTKNVCCPKCGCSVGKYNKNLRIKKYCPSCGQKLSVINNE